jgi:ectoine hydroxylase-related dioxygenase (phytanoyl-CoA dioxygenase family)
VLRRGFRSHARRHDVEGSTNGPDALKQESMPNSVKMALPAGSAFMFDSSTWHTCANTYPLVCCDMQVTMLLQ